MKESAWRTLKTAATALLGIGLLALAAVLYLTRGGGTPAPAAPARAAASPVSVVHGQTVITLGARAQQAAGLQVAPVPAQVRRSERTAYGAVMALQPLIELRGRLEDARAQQQAAQASAKASQAQLARSRALYEDNRNISLKALQAAQAQYDADRAKADAAAVQVRAVERSALQQFGPTLAQWLTARKSAPLEQLLAGKSSLVRITLPPGLDATPSQVRIEVAGGQPEPADFVSAAAQAAPGLAGRNLVYRAQGSLAQDTPVLAHLPTQDPATPGVLVPRDAVVWYAGQPWAYQQTDATHFARRPLRDASERDDGYFSAGPLQPGDRVVVQGAQLLLSEEQRPPPGGGCKDPECDD